MTKINHNKIILQTIKLSNLFEKLAIMPGDELDLLPPPDPDIPKEVYDKIKKELNDPSREDIVFVVHIILGILSIIPQLRWLDVVNAAIYIFQGKFVKAAFALIMLVIPPVPGLSEAVRNKDITKLKEIFSTFKDKISLVISAINSVAPKANLTEEIILKQV